MIGDLSANQIDEVLRSEVIGRIGCTAQGWPYVVPITYVYDGQFVYGHSSEGLKLRIMRENPLVCFEVEQIRSIRNWRCVVARGQFSQLWSDDAERAMDLLAARFAPPASKDGSSRDRDEAAHREHGIIRPILFRIQLVDRTGRYQQD
jgi:uncharacterized protein